jgi:hypothetical protein
MRYSVTKPVSLDTADQDRDSVSVGEVLPALEGRSLGVLLYGSRARGAYRPDSDVDVLQLVPSRPRSYSRGRVNVASYTPDHLMHLAREGSLFVRHLHDEGIILQDSRGLLSNVLNQYRAPASYDRLKREMGVILTALSTVDPQLASAGMTRLAVYAARTALYVNAAESGRLTFDTEKASADCGVPELASLLRTCFPEDGMTVTSIGQRLLEVRPPADTPADLPAIAVWSLGRFPLAARLLEVALAGESQISYTSLTLPPA